ncbi:MAG: hypothetical protein ACI9DF_003465 [Verrucomicrobiales bacterium]|jgi:hypothetical protein
MTFTAIDVASHQLEVIGVPASMIFSVDGLTPTKGMVYALPSEEGVYTWKLQTEETKIEEAPPSLWHSQSETIVRYEDERLLFASRVHLTASEGNGRTATLLLPQEATDIEIKRRDLESW